MTTIQGAFAPIREDFLQRVRRDGRDDLNQPVKRVVAKGGEPCRDAMRRAKPGEELILASYSPFTVEGPYREFGPIFVFANENARDANGSLPIGAPDTYLREQFVVRAYSYNEEILDAALIEASAAQQTVEKFFARDDIKFLHVRFPTYGCFACRIDRSA